MSSTGPLKHGMQTGVLPDSDRRLAPQGWWGGKQERGEGEAGEASAQQDG